MVEEGRGTYFSVGSRKEAVVFHKPWFVILPPGALALEDKWGQNAT